MSSRGNRRGRGHFNPNYPSGRGRGNFNYGNAPGEQYSNEDHKLQSQNAPQNQRASSRGQNRQSRGGREAYQQKAHYRSESSLHPDPPVSSQPLNFNIPAGNAATHSVSFTIHTSQNVTPHFVDETLGQRQTHVPYDSAASNTFSVPNSGATKKSHIQIYDKNQSRALSHPRNTSFQQNRHVSPNQQSRSNNPNTNNFRGRHPSPCQQTRPNFQNNSHVFHVPPLHNVRPSHSPNYQCMSSLQDIRSKQNPNYEHNVRTSPLQNVGSNQNSSYQQSVHVSPFQNVRSNQYHNYQQNERVSPLQNVRSIQNPNHQHNVRVSPLQNSRPPNYQQNFHMSPPVTDQFQQKARIQNEQRPKDLKPVYAKINTASKNVQAPKADLNKDFSSSESPIEKKKARKKRQNPNKINAKTHQRNAKDAQKSRRQQSKQFFTKKKKSNVETSTAPSLFSFQREPEAQASTDRFSDPQDSDEDCDSTIVSVCSSHASSESVSSDQENKGSDEDSSEEESEIMSELSVSSSIKSSGVAASYKSQSSISEFQYSSKPEACVSSFWDIENCALPSNKSAFDFVKKIRDTFYEGRTEQEFYVVCDVVNTLSSPSVQKELSEANVTVVHTSNADKNAADKKLQSFFYDFKLNNSHKKAAIVLISSDSDFASFLSDMQYKHGIYINLICKENCRDPLKKAANTVVLYEEFVKDLPNRSKKEENDHFLILTNFPKDSEPKKIKKFLCDKMISINGRVKSVNSTEAQLSFSNEGALERAWLLLKGLTFEGNKIDMTHIVKNREKIKKDSKQKSDAQDSHSNTEQNNAEVKESKKALKKSKENLQQKAVKQIKNDLGKGATLCVYVNDKLGNIQHWQIEFSNLWENSEFQLEWNESSTEGYFLVHFKSLSKAQKAKKILQKNQKIDTLAPKFLKIIKEDSKMDISLNTIESFGETEMFMKKVEENLKIINLKRERCLKSHLEAVNEVKHSKATEISGAEEAVKDKLNELNSQKVTFLNFSENVTKAVQSVNTSSENYESYLDDLIRDYSRECNCFSAALPIYAKKTVILKKVKGHQVVVIRAETGSGKSTQLTQYLLREKGVCDTGFIVCTQPRKIAAISLARHVSSQVGSSLGDLVGYQVGLSAKKSAKTRVLYMTDFTMLKMIVSDSCIKNVSCIIIDEAHERSIYTDLLLGMVKSCLKQRPDLKVIITSATIDTTIFKDYFNLTDDSVLHVSGRTFPIDDKWLDKDVQLGWNYFDATVKMAYSLLDEEQGDILAFLTTPIETEKAVEVFKSTMEKNGDQRNTLVFQLHGKLDVQEQQKIFDRTPKGTRKVVFSTNCAETSVTIPGIRYVVDCGMVKESQFDVKRNMNILSVGFVSRSSAEQRRGRAGRTQVGKCYRLYSENNYKKDMAESTDPEILRVNLGQALLKLMEMGVQDPVQFDFVKSPPQESLDKAMKQLIYLEAVNIIDLSLTELGRKMAHLPLEPRLSYLVFQGIDHSIGYEAVILAALVTVSRSIFFRNSDNKIEADKKKMRFCQSESDFITYFEVYKQWLLVPKDGRTKWCVINCINARSMRVAHDLINELILTLSKEANLNLSQKYNSDEFVSDVLLKIIFHAFSQNICVFSGHHRLGYRSCDVPDELLIHPSSSLYTFGGQWRPKYLVYDTILKTDQTYLINVSHMDENTVIDAYECGRLDVDLSTLNSLALVPVCIGPIGESVIIRDIIGKKGTKIKCIQKKVKENIQNEPVIIEADVKRGEVKVFTAPANHEIATQIISISITEGMQSFLKEQREIYNITDCLGLTGVVAAGAEVKDIVLPGEFRDVKIILNNNDIEISEVIQKLNEYGELILPERKFKNHYRVTFSSPVCAKEAVEVFKNDTLFCLQGLSNANHFDQPPFYKVLVSTLRRPCSGEAFMTIDDHYLTEASNVLLHKSIYYQNALLKISISKKSLDFRIFGLPPNTERKSLETVMKSCLPSEVKISKLVVVRIKPFQSSKEDIERFKETLINIFAGFTPREKIMVDLKKPVMKDFTWNGIVYFKNSHDGETAVNALKGNAYLTGSSLNSLVMKPMLQTCLFSKQDIVAVAKEQIEAALKFFNKTANSTDTLKINALAKGVQNVQVIITSNNISDIIDARKAISNILQGEQIKCNGSAVLEKLFSTAGMAFLDELQRSSPSALIYYNTHSKVISLFGDDSACTKIKTKINSFLDRLVDENYKEIPLVSETCRRGILKELLRSYGYSLEELKNFCNLTTVEVNSHKQILTIRGSQSSVNQCEIILKRIEDELTDRPAPEIEGEECPICLDTVSDQYKRLEYCGHAYCKECILNLLQNSDTFPISCLICNSPIVVADIVWATKEVKSLESDMYQKALASFAATKSEIKYCPSPDCRMLYRLTSNKDNMFDCPSCNNTICTKCCVLYHFGMDCEIYQCCQNDDDHSLKVYLSKNPENRKMCPSCKAPIEKNGGCNHMTCWKCKCHMCWLCLKTFSTPDGVYHHQSTCTRRHV